MKNREIKFRAWDNVNNVMKHFDYILENFDAQDLFKGRFTLQQYTGLKDCKGEEIYVGDILKDVTNDNIETVDGFDFSYGWKQHLNYKNIIGNIFENKDLLP